MIFLLILRKHYMYKHIFLRFPFETHRFLCNIITLSIRFEDVNDGKNLFVFHVFQS